MPAQLHHVWNYAQALAHLFPELERSMRETELETLLHRDGYLPHRVILPLYLPQLSAPSAARNDPALDGMLGCRAQDLPRGASRPGDDWLRAALAALRRLMDQSPGRGTPT